MALAIVWVQGLTVEDHDGALDDYNDSSESGQEASVLVQLPDDDSLEAVEEAAYPVVLEAMRRRLGDDITHVGWGNIQWKRRN